MQFIATIHHTINQTAPRAAPSAGTPGPWYTDMHVIGAIIGIALIVTFLAVIAVFVIKAFKRKPIIRVFLLAANGNYRELKRGFTARGVDYKDAEGTDKTATLEARLMRHNPLTGAIAWVDEATGRQIAPALMPTERGDVFGDDWEFIDPRSQHAAWHDGYVESFNRQRETGFLAALARYTPVILIVIGFLLLSLIGGVIYVAQRVAA
jgi:hypothetical protein